LDSGKERPNVYSGCPLKKGFSSIVGHNKLSDYNGFWGSLWKLKIGFEAKVFARKNFCLELGIAN